MIGKTECSKPCNLCKATNVAELCLKDRRGGYLRTVICKECGLIWTDPPPHEDRLKEFYSKEYRKEYKGIYEPKRKHLYRDAKSAIRRITFLKDLLKKEDRILDIGAGSGVFVYVLCKLGFGASGIGADEKYSKYAREELQVPVRTGFAQDLNRGESYDIVTLHHVLEHMINPLQELRNIRNIIKENGYLVIAVPNAEDIRQDPNNRYHKAHLYTFNPETLEEIGKKAGFEVDKKEGALLNGNITIIFKKMPVNSISGKIPGNYARVTELLNRNTTFTHFTSSVPYRKFLANALNAIEEIAAVRKFTRGKEIINSAISKDFYQQSGG